MTGVVNPRQSALEIPLCRHHFSRKLLAFLALAGDRLRPLSIGGARRSHLESAKYLFPGTSIRGYKWSEHRPER